MINLTIAAPMYRPCPLCTTPDPTLFFCGPQRDYLRCGRCGLIFVPREELLPPFEEKARYDLHENNPADQGYRHFFTQLIQPFLARIGPPPQEGLDFGSGPGPALAQMLADRSYSMSCYDPFYQPDTQALERPYDFVTCTEAMEHFNQPAREWKILLGLLRPGGWMGLMTKLVDRPAHFPEMHYITDRTHVSFFSRRTFIYLAGRYSLDVKFFGDNVILIHKPGAA